VKCLVRPPRWCEVEDALSESQGLLASAESDDAVAVGAWALAPTKRVVLGSLQRRARAVGTCPVAVARRGTTGTAACVDGGLLVSIALPSIDALFEDATAATLLNRNVRPLLRGLAAAGIPCAYFGRDTLVWRRRPVFVLGLEVTRTGAVLVEAIASWRGPLRPPPEWCSDFERSLARDRGASSASLSEIAGDARPAIELARAAVAGMCDAIAADRTNVIDRVAAPSTTPAPELELDVSEWLAPESVPIGALDVGRTGSEPWVGGDLLAPSYALGHAVTAIDHGLPLIGATWDDVARAARRAVATG
jgi:hypothetical protein